ncbi:hypothetical protein HHI36_018781 [Cryptolaemus montrouzieri]|uniref:Uncharacterized protein n=1 Tax=Cryptolaemus montrouzieri TaxID=559131 RepID=A0ABD2P142_9CUCU
MGTPEEFVTEFHNLKGTTLREKKKSLHNLLIRYKSSSTDTLDSIIQGLTPATYLEESFKIELLLYFQRSKELLNVLTAGNEIGACKIVRQKWFIEDLLKTYTSTQFVEQLCPQLSLSIRTKILKRILMYVKDESKIQELFEVLNRVYGWKVASILFTGCPDEKIKEILRNFTTELSVPKLKQLLYKNKSLIGYYFELFENVEGVDNYKWRSFFKYMAVKDPIYFSELSKKFDIHIYRQFGRQTTKKFIDVKKDDVLNKPDEFTRYLRGDALVRKLGEDFPKFFRNGLPKNITSLNYCSVRELLKYYDKSKQYELYFNAFQETYNKSLWDNIDYMDERLIELISDVKEREEWIKKFDKRANYMKYQKRDVMARCMMMSAPMVFDEDDDMGLSGQDAIIERKTIFNTLISTCKLNQDYATLVNILKSFCERHRNSDVTILYNFLRTIYNELDMKN